MQTDPISFYMLILYVLCKIKSKILLKRHIQTMYMLLRIDPLLSGDSVNSGRCYVTPATYTHATTEQRGYAARF
jgi:hypothetical protein